jgi:isopentenyldiphosphate isomerase
MTDIIFVDENDIPIGSGSMQDAREKGIVYRIIQIFITNSKGEMLLQRRASHAHMTSAGKWDQSVGGHVDAGEGYDEAAYREMKEEIGIENVPLREVKKYYSEGGDVSIIKRFNMLYTGVYDGEVMPNPEEISEVKWINPADLEAWIERSPNDFTNGCINAYIHLKQSMKN